MEDGIMGNANSKEKGVGRELRGNQQPAITSMFLKHLTMNSVFPMEITNFQQGNNSLEPLEIRPRPAPHISLMPPSNTCTLPYHFKIHILSKLCLTSTTCACPCTSSPSPRYNSMWDFLFSSPSS
ncbi:hypothetical protein OIU85_026169 [Salix viminalis]|uniref:Uncharacterized protein n=1 Tax=Salix viminalis TaxID=40686 RepID=A0A9Q0TN63_SALVM|nr:hypothetical protein OIU85_026169 [Salix viminalis]